ncbi:MAG TPA: response regulator [Geobacteraceae bacterium]
MSRVLIIDDDAAFTSLLSESIHKSYPLLQVETCNNPLNALAVIRNGGFDLLLIDMEMPSLDGMKVFRFATAAGIDKNRIIILSGRETEYLREFFPLGSCLAVLNKYEAKQKEVLNMILGSLQRKVAV